jgi:two-component system LytT family response regulator
MIKAIIVDDEDHCRATLFMQLTRYCPEVSVVAECSSAAEGLKVIVEKSPDVVFLDVEMPHMNGFEMLEQLPVPSFEVIFTTGYDAYAIQAIRFSALDYLLKPIDRDDLRKSVSKINREKENLMAQQLNILFQKLKNQLLLQKIAFLPFRALK